MDEATFARLMDERLEDHPTRQDLADTLAKAIAPLAPGQELAASAEDVKRHFNVVAESMHDHIKVVADGVLALSERLDRISEENQRWLVKHDTQLDRLDVRVSRLDEHTGLEPL